MGVRLVYDQERDSIFDLNEVWLCAGIDRPYRITSWRRDYGEFNSMDDALDFKRLLLLGNPDLREKA